MTIAFKGFSCTLESITAFIFSIFSNNCKIEINIYLLFYSCILLSVISIIQEGCESCKKAKMYYQSCLDTNKSLGKYRKYIATRCFFACLWPISSGSAGPIWLNFFLLAPSWSRDGFRPKKIPVPGSGNPEKPGF